MGPDAGMTAPPPLRNGAEVLRGVLLHHAEHLVALLVEDECTRFLAHAGDQRDEHGRHSLVRNGLQPERTIRTGIGPVRVRLPKFRSRTGAHVEFRSMYVPRFARTAAEARPGAAWLYLNAIIHCDIHGALAALMEQNGSHAAMSIPEATRQEWTRQCERMRGDALDARQWTRIWAFEVEGRAEGPGRVPDIIVVLGEDEAGHTRLLCANLETTSTDPWAGVLRNLQARGLRSSMDTWVVSTCALGLVETMKVHGPAVGSRDHRDSGTPGVRAGSGNRLPSPTSYLGPASWISALLVVSGMGIAQECAPLQKAAATNASAQHASASREDKE